MFLRVRCLMLGARDLVPGQEKSIWTRHRWPPFRGPMETLLLLQCTTNLFSNCMPQSVHQIFDSFNLNVICKYAHCPLLGNWGGGGVQGGGGGLVFNQKKTQHKVPKNTLTYPEICVNGKLGVTFRFQDFSVSKKYRIRFQKNLLWEKNSGFGFV